MTTTRRFEVLHDDLVLGYDSHVHHPTPSRRKIQRPGAILILDSVAPNGNVWFFDSDGERGCIEAGSIENLTRGYPARLGEVTAMNRYLVLTPYTCDCEGYPQTDATVIIAKSASAAELAARAYVERCHSSGARLGFASAIPLDHALKGWADGNEFTVKELSKMPNGDA